MQIILAKLQLFSRFSYIWKFDDQLEENYNLFVRASNLTSLRLVSFITIFGMSIFLIIDMFKDVEYSIVLFTRIIVLTGASAIMWLSTRNISTQTITFCIVMIVLLNFGASLTTATLARMPSYYITNLLFLIFVLVVTASGLHFRYSLYVNFSCLVIFLIYSQWINQNPFYYSQYPHLFSIFVYIHIVGIVLENRRRKNFLQFNDLVEQKKLVEELNQQKNKVISILSHDIAAPMNSLSKILHLQAHGQIDQAHLEPFMDGLRKEINNVSYLLTGLVRWSRSQMQGFVLHKTLVDLEAIVMEMEKLFHLQLVHKNLELTKKTSPTLVKADEEMIRIVLRNLISNAIRFANRNSTIGVEISTHNNGHAKIFISNEGQLIPDDLREKLFTYQMPVKEDGEGQRGAGLGLAMSAFFVTLHNGLIHLEPSTEARTTFCVELPLDK